MSSASSRKMTTTSTTAWVKQFDQFAPTAFADYSSKVPAKEWARMYTLRFLHEVNRNVPFASVYTALLNYARDHSVTKGTEPTFTVTFKAAPQETVTKAPASPSAPVLMINRNLFNRILFAELEMWYDAFVAEVEEDNSIAESAKQEETNFRWAHLATNTVVRRTGIAYEQLQPHVLSWIQRHAPN